MSVILKYEEMHTKRNSAEDERGKERERVRTVRHVSHVRGIEGEFYLCIFPSETSLRTDVVLIVLHVMLPLSFMSISFCSSSFSSFLSLTIYFLSLHFSSSVTLHYLVFFFPLFSDAFRPALGPPSLLLSMGTGGSFPGSKGAGDEDDHSRPCSVEVKNA